MAVLLQRRVGLFLIHLILLLNTGEAKIFGEKPNRQLALHVLACCRGNG